MNRGGVVDPSHPAFNRLTWPEIMALLCYWGSLAWSYADDTWSPEKLRGLEFDPRSNAHCGSRQWRIGVGRDRASRTDGTGKLPVPRISMQRTRELRATPASCRTILHCHARGLHSILLHTDPVVRLFVADVDHDLWTNGLADGIGASRFAGQSVAFHRHAYDLTLTHVAGSVWNVLGHAARDEVWKSMDVVVFGSKGYSTPFYRCIYGSKIVDGSGSLRALDAGVHVLTDYQRLGSVPHRMPNLDLHTVAVPKGERAAWLVCEGPRILDAPRIVYTTNPNFDATDLYVEGNAADLRRLLDLAGVGAVMRALALAGLPDAVVDSIRTTLDEVSR